MLLFLAGLLEKLGLAWWEHHESEEADNAANNVDALDKSDLDSMRGKWTRK